MCLIVFFVVVVMSWVFEKLYYYRDYKSVYFLFFEFIVYVYGNIFYVLFIKIQVKIYVVLSVMVVVNFVVFVFVSLYIVNLLVFFIIVEEINIVLGIVDEKVSE